MSSTVRVGRALKSERERQGLSLKKIARVSGIDLERLESMEAGELDRLPPGAFAKGFIRTYATYLGVEPDPLVEVYESSFGDPLDIASLNHQPLELPKASHPRTWRMAACGAFAFILLLAAVGVFSNDDPSDTIDPARASVSLGSQDAVGNEGSVFGSGVLLKIEAATGRSWVKVIEDGKPTFTGIVEKGQSETFLASDTIMVTLGNPQAIKISANGTDLGAPEFAEYTAVFTSQTRILPPPG